MVAAVTRTIPPKPYPFVVIIEADESGLPHRSAVNCSQVATVQTGGSDCRLRPLPGETEIRPIGRLGARTLERIDAALRYNFSLG